MSLAARIARSLEEGHRGPLFSAAGAVWGALAAQSLVKPLVFGQDKRVVVVGGATLGGSGKTPLAMECARYIASLGESVAFVGHGYGANLDEARIVTRRDHISYVGDEALVAVRLLAPAGVPVVVAAERQDALDLALHHARVVVVDSVAQTAPVRAHLAILAVDAKNPWGSGVCPPGGDQRAPRDALAAVADRIVAVGDNAALSYELTPFDRPLDQVMARSRGAWLDGNLISWAAIRRHRVGLWTCLARPSRLVEQLARERIVPKVVASYPDHARITTADTTQRAQSAVAAGVDLWLATAKCAVHLPRHLERVPLAVLDYELALGGGLKRALRDAITV